MDHRVIAPKPFRNRTAVAVLDGALALAGVAAVASLIAEYGFRTPPISLATLHAVQGIIVGIFVLDRLVRLALARQRREYLKGNWIDFALMAIAVVGFAASLHVRGKVLPFAALYVIITQAYLLVALLLRGVGLNLRFTGSGIHPSVLVIGSFIFLSLSGSGLLMLPVAHPPEATGPYYIDALFTATSATCVTGLIVRDTGSDWSPFGQAVILLLIQIGGLGIMVSGTMLAALLGKSLTIRGSDTVGQMLATDRVGELSRVVKFVLLTALVVEAMGAVLFYSMFARASGATVPIPAGRAAWQSIFHSVSSFCNAGFSLMGANMMEGVGQNWSRPLRDHWQIMGVMAPLIVLGGLGFPVLQDCARWAFRSVQALRYRRTPAASASFPTRHRLSLHSKIVLWTSAVLLLVGTVGFLVLEPGPREPRRAVGYHATIDMVSPAKADWPAMSRYGRLRAAIFQSVTARTAGFNTINMSDLSSAGKAWVCGLMVIGGSPASTAGGMKTVTVAVLVLVAYCVIRKRNNVEVFGRTIPRQLVHKALTLALLYVCLLTCVVLLLTVAMRGHDFMNLLFEACSACGTVGLSTGVTRQLNVFGKCVIIAGMFIGRIGPVTMLIALAGRAKYVAYEYPTETVVVG